MAHHCPIKVLDAVLLDLSNSSNCVFTNSFICINCSCTVVSNDALILNNKALEISKSGFAILNKSEKAVFGFHLIKLK